MTSIRVLEECGLSCIKLFARVLFQCILEMSVFLFLMMSMWNTFSRIRSGVRRTNFRRSCRRILKKKNTMILNRSLRKSNLLLKGWLLSISFFSFVMICGSRNHPKEDGSKKQTYVDSKINSQKIANRTLFLKGHDVHGAYCPSFVTRQTLERSAPILHEAVQVRVLSGWEAQRSCLIPSQFKGTLSWATFSLVQRGEAYLQSCQSS